MSSQQPVTSTCVCPMPWLPMVITALMVVLLLMTIKYAVDYVRATMLRPKKRYDHDDDEEEEDEDEEEEEDRAPIRKRKNKKY